MCERVALEGGGFAFVCGGRYPRRRCACGARATLQCDWKVPGKRSGTCDAYVCRSCATSPAAGKDLCKRHTAAFAHWQRAHAQRDLFTDYRAGSGSRPDATPFPDPAMPALRPAGAASHKPETYPS